MEGDCLRVEAAERIPVQRVIRVPEDEDVAGSAVEDVGPLVEAEHLARLLRGALWGPRPLGRGPLWLVHSRGLGIGHEGQGQVVEGARAR